MAAGLNIGYRWTATAEEPAGDPSGGGSGGGGSGGGGTGGGSGGGPAAAPDKRSPKFRLGGKKRQHVLPRARRKAGLVVVVGSDEAATVRVKVELEPKRGPKAKAGRKSKRSLKAATLSFKGATKRLLAGNRTKLPLKLSPKSARLARRLLRGKAAQTGVNATVVASATDASGNRTTKRLRVLLLK
jgi:hypothetical protein